MNCLLFVAGLVLIFAATSSAQKQFDYGDSDTTKVDTTAAAQDTTKPAEPVKQFEEAEEPEQTEDLTPAIVTQATTWTRRLFYRGFFDMETTGTWATYQESDWGPKTGSSGPVRAHLTVNYLGATSWLGRDAEHFQVVYRTLSAPKTTVEFDMIVNVNEAKLDSIYRGLYRVDKGELMPANFSLSGGTLDYDKMDKPKSEEATTQLELYSGKYDATVYSGTGTNAAKVYAYRVSDLPPLGLVLLGYGNEALTYKSGGDGAESRFEAPSPSIR